MVTPGELNKELEDVEAIIPEHHIIDVPLLDRAKNLKLDSDSQIPSFENNVHKDPDYPIETYAP